MARTVDHGFLVPRDLYLSTCTTKRKHVPIYVPCTYDCCWYSSPPHPHIIVKPAAFCLLLCCAALLCSYTILDGCSKYELKRQMVFISQTSLSFLHVPPSYQVHIFCWTSCGSCIFYTLFYLFSCYDARKLNGSIYCGCSVAWLNISTCADAAALRWCAAISTISTAE